jgi:hypothetical protein
MSLVTDVVWSAFSYGDPWSREVDKAVTFLPPWAGVASNGAHVAMVVVQDYCMGDWWTQHIGNEVTEAEMLVQIHEPAAVAGFYRVELERVTKAQARPMQGDPRDAR